MESPDIYVLAQLRWQFFGTLTFTKERMPERVRLAMVFAMLRGVAAKYRVFFPRLPWCLRQESGEQFGRRHFHFLLTGLPQNVVTISTCFVIMHQWEQQGGGMARVHVFDHKLNGVGYITKCLGQTPDAGDLYESAKFGSKDCELMLSHGAQAILRSRVNATERRLAQ